MAAAKVQLPPKFCYRGFLEFGRRLFPGNQIKRAAAPRSRPVELTIDLSAEVARLILALGSRSASSVAASRLAIMVIIRTIVDIQRSRPASELSEWRAEVAMCQHRALVIGARP